MMKVVLTVLMLVGFLMADGYTLAPDGSYVGGSKPILTPGGNYIGD